MLSKKFWIATGERAAKTFAQTLAALIGAAATTNIVAFDWPGLFGVSATATVLSVLTSIVSAPASEPDREGDRTPSLVGEGTAP